MPLRGLAESSFAVVLCHAITGAGACAPRHSLKQAAPLKGQRQHGKGGRRHATSHPTPAAPRRGANTTVGGTAPGHWGRLHCRGPALSG